MRYSPWAAAALIPDLAIRFADLPIETGGACLARRPGQTWIILDRLSTKAERDCNLAHELIHLERGSSSRMCAAPETWDDVVRREEMWVDREVAARLVPRRELMLTIAVRMTNESIDADLVAEAFCVTRRVAKIAMEGLSETRHLRAVPPV